MPNGLGGFGLPRYIKQSANYEGYDWTGEGDGQENTQSDSNTQNESTTETGTDSTVPTPTTSGGELSASATEYTPAK